MSVKRILETVDAMATAFYEETGIKVSCERCFYVTDPTCPRSKHICELEEAMKDPTEREWVHQKMKDKIAMRKAFVKAVEDQMNRP